MPAIGPFRRLLLAYAANGAANGVPATLFLFVDLHVLHMLEVSGAGEPGATRWVAPDMRSCEVASPAP